MKKSIKILIFDKEDSLSFGEWSDVEDYLEENNLTEKQYLRVRQNLNKNVDTITLIKDEKDINEYLSDPEDPNSQIFSDIYDHLLDKYKFPILPFRTKVMSIKDLK